MNVSEEDGDDSIPGISQDDESQCAPSYSPSYPSNLVEHQDSSQSSDIQDQSDFNTLNPDSSNNIPDQENNFFHSFPNNNSFPQSNNSTHSNSSSSRSSIASPQYAPLESPVGSEDATSSKFRSESSKSSPSVTPADLAAVMPFSPQDPAPGSLVNSRSTTPVPVSFPIQSPSHSNSSAPSPVNFVTDGPVKSNSTIGSPLGTPSDQLVASPYSNPVSSANSPSQISIDSASINQVNSTVQFQSNIGSPADSPVGSSIGSEAILPSTSQIASPSGSLVETPIGSPNHSQVGSPIRSPVDSPVGSPIGSPADSPVRSPIGTHADSPVGSPIGSPADSPVGSPIGSPADSPVGSPIGSPVDSPVGSPIGSPVDSPVGSPIGSPVDSPVGSPIGSPVDSPVGSPIGTSAERPLGSPIGSPDSAVPSRDGSPISPAHSSNNESPVHRSGTSSSGNLSPNSPSALESGGEADIPASSPFDQHDDTREISSDVENMDGDAVKEPKKGDKDSDEESDKQSEVGELIADIFGSSDEEEEFEGFQAEEVEQSLGDENKDRTAHKSVLPDVSSDEDENDPRRSVPSDFVSDFDMMLAKRKAEQSNSRRRNKNSEIINDNDDLIVNLISKMKDSAEEDRELNNQKKPATRKMKLLPVVKAQLMKSQLHMAFLDCGVLNAITEWLAPLPDRSLPHLKIRETMLVLLSEFPLIGTEQLKMSGIGKAVMYLYKHPKELRKNKEVAGKLVNEWSRPIFNLTTNYQSLSREEREERDYEQLPKKRKINDGSKTPGRGIDGELASSDTVLKPGDPGYVYRARVPQPSHKDYVVRPKWALEEKRRPKKKTLTRYEKQVRKMMEKKRNTAQQRAVTISVEGKNINF